MPFSMSAVLKYIDVRGSSMGSRQEFAEMVWFVNENRLKPVISRVVTGFDDLDAIDGLFEDMNGGKQFGNLVINLQGEDSSSRL